MEQQAFGVIYIGAFQRIDILEVEHSIDDWVKFTWVTDGKASRPSRAKLRNDYQGNGFFVSHGDRFYLKDAVKIR